MRMFILPTHWFKTAKLDVFVEWVLETRATSKHRLSRKNQTQRYYHASECTGNNFGPSVFSYNFFCEDCQHVKETVKK